MRTTALVIVTGVVGLLVGSGRPEASSPSDMGALRVLVTLLLHGILLALLVRREREVPLPTEQFEELPAGLPSPA